MRSDPVLAILNWPVDHQDGTPIGRFDNTVHHGVIANRRHDLRAIFFGIDIEASGRDAVLDQFHKRAAGLHDRRRQPVHFNVTIIDDKNTLVCVEQNDALRHIVEDQGLQRAVVVSTSALAHERVRDRHKNGDDDGVRLDVQFGKINQDPRAPRCDLIGLQAFINC